MVAFEGGLCMDIWRKNDDRHDCCLMQASPRLTLSEEAAKALTARIQDAGTEVVKAKASPSPFVHFRLVKGLKCRFSIYSLLVL